MCWLPLRLFILWMFITSGCCITCPDSVERTIAPGETCFFLDYQVNGKSVADHRWNYGPNMQLKPGKDCFPEGFYGFTHTIGGDSCSVSIRIKGVCSWNPNHCWPGDCNSNLASNCQCRQGFYTNRIEDNSYPSKTFYSRRCRLDSGPDLNTCRVAVTDRHGHSTNSTHSGSRTDCSSQQDEFINTQPDQLYFVLKSDFSRTVGSSVAYVSETKIGIVGANITVVKKSMDGSESTIVEQDLRHRPSCQHDAGTMNPVTGTFHACEATLTLPQSKVNLADGDRVCAKMMATAGGYYKLQNDASQYQSTATFPETYSSKEVCFTMDKTKPVHCISTGGSCTGQPMTLSTRLSRLRHVTVHVTGWTDPEPGGRSGLASGLSRFRLEVHGVDVGKDSLTVQQGAIASLNQEWNSNLSSSAGPYRVQVTLPEEEHARLYAVMLEVHDKVGNVAYVRRLVLLDNASSVDLWPSASLAVVHADPRSNKRWQTDPSKELCVNWTGRFYNTDMYNSNSNLLKKVTTDPALHLSGDYDQISGVLPISGTNNVVGITKFEIAWSRNEAPRSALTEVSDLFPQSTCLQNSLHDGETYDVWIRASDIMDNTREDKVRVSIDYTGPEVHPKGLLARWNREGLYVHNNTDLSTMTLVLSVADPHSGLSTIHWTLSTRPLADEVGRGTVAVQRPDNMTSCSGQDDCYCPSVGDCEIHRFLLTFTSLVHNHTQRGDHHRDYYISVTVTNGASLSATTRVKILLDESPPTVGVVWEGLAEDGQAEMDYTSSRVVHVRWHGFQDPESSVSLYRVVMAGRCLTAVEVDRAANTSEVQNDNMASFTFPEEGRYFFSVVAYNGALEPSEAACSDGIMYDTTPPTLRNVSVTHARGGHMIGCTQQQQPQAWLVHSNLTRVALQNSSHCQLLCSGPSSGLNVQHLPVSSPHVVELDESDHYCRTLPKVQEDSVTVLPSDYVRITWQGQDEESQIEEYYIGMGGDRTASSAPDLLPLTSTHGHASYHARHVGLGHGDRFFVFLQVVTKAGLSTTLTLGPILIDVTAPQVTQPLTAEIEDGLLLVSWQDGVFSDPEQPNNVDLEISFLIGHDDGFVTPLHTMKELNMTRCLKAHVDGCVFFPVKDLYAFDSEKGRSFFFQLHVINAAGHVSSVNTSSVRLPVHFAPSHAVILDVLRLTTSDPATTAPPTVTLSMATGPTTSDPHTQESSSQEPPSMFTSLSSTGLSTESLKTPSITDRFTDDVDTILQAKEVCVAWKGFYHQEEIQIDVGVGTKPDHDDVIKFHSANNQSPVCVNLTSAPVSTKLFSVVKATTSGGTSVFSSDGFVIMPEIDPENYLKVYNGKGCHENDIIGKELIVKLSPSFNMNEIARLPIHAGDFLFIELSPFIPQVVFNNATLLQTTFAGYQLIADTSNITAVFPNRLAANTSVQIQRCQKDSSVVHLPNNQFTFTWEMSAAKELYVKNFETAIIDTTCLAVAVKKEKYVLQKCTLHKQKMSAITREETVFLENLSNTFLQGHTYISSVSLCFDNTCLPPVRSEPVTYGTTYASVQFYQGSIVGKGMQQLTVDVEATAVQEPVTFSNRTCMYMWTISADRSGSVPLADWVVENTLNCSNIEITQTIPVRGQGHGTRYICLRLLFPIQSRQPDCFQLSLSPETNVGEPFHVIELSHRIFRQTDFEPYLSSQQLGNKLHELYDLDLDFATSDVLLTAVLTNSLDRNVTWFLMTAPHAPYSGDCAGDEECVTSKTTQSHVLFPRHRSKLQSGHVYYICAVLAGELGRTAGMGPQMSLQQICGDGVVIDDSPPVRGSVTIDNTDGGYLAADGHVTVSWSGFTDVEIDLPLLGDSTTLNFSVALGSYPGAEDLASFVHVGQRSVWTFNHLTLPSGVTCVATVRAQDRVGHVTEGWSNQVVIDSTPPTVGHVAAGTITAEDFIPGHELPVHWENVEDRESGVFRIEVGLAQQGGGDNVVDFQTCEETSAILTDVSGLLDGHAYVVLLKVTNKAGLTAIESSAPFVIDSSPPSPGRVWHSDSSTTIVGGYSRHVGEYSVRWTEFTDPHSGLDYYRVGLGTAPGLTDVSPFVYVGRQTAYTWTQELEQGTNYYATLQACNRAGLCQVTSSSSLTFDDSPPTSGHVTVGLYGRHDKFLGHNSSVPVQWTGFSDPQTGVQHFTWCVGLAPRVCDVLPISQALLSRAAHEAGLALPLVTPLYVTVTAYNPAGLQTSSVSHSFVVDPTPPEVVVKPQFLSARDGSPASSQWDRSVVHLVWLFRDLESSVVSHTVYLRSQLTGRLVCDPITLGPDTQLTLTLDQTSLLTDGDIHWASVSACNAAHLCVTATSDIILIDSTPPVTGTFLSPLSWKQVAFSAGSNVATVIALEWRGFSDAESDLLGYDVIAGRSYNGEELSGGRVRVDHNDTAQIQHHRLEVREQLQAGYVLHLAILAENGLHLRSPLVRMAFDCLQDNAQGTSGSLELIRHSCQASYCTMECTCAASGKVCQGSRPSPCVELNSTNPDLSALQTLPHMGMPGTPQSLNSSISAHVFSPVRRLEMFFTSSKCMEGHWSLSQPQSLPNVSRFEYSFSLTKMSAGEGVFNAQTEPVWYDVGHHMTTVHCLPGNRTLTSGYSYILHVRVWPSHDSHMTFVSPPSILDHSIPKVKQGRAVLDSDTLCSKDIDYVTANRSEVTACWDGVFQDVQSQVTGYQIWIGTTPKASDHQSVTDVGLNTTWTFSTTILEPGRRYYVTVRAWNGVGMHSTAVSDGVLVDVTPPVPGVVFPSGHHSNRHVQSSTSTLSASWHGFEDSHSGVRSYHVAVLDVENGSVPDSFRDVGMKTKVHLSDLVLTNGHRYKVAVKAVDAAGLESQVVESAAILVDVTPPEGVTCKDFELVENVTLTPSMTPFPLQDRYLADVTLSVTQAGEEMKVDLTVVGVDSSVLGYLHVAELRMPLSFQVSVSGVRTAHHSFLCPYSGAVPLQLVVEGPAQATITAELSRCLHTRPSSQHAVTLRQMSAYGLSVCSRVRDQDSGLRTIMVGVGTTPGGLQVQPWTRVGYSGHVSMDVHVQHATTLYAAVISENRAGQWSRFVSAPILLDRTGPEVSNVKLTLRYDDGGKGSEGDWTSTKVWAKGGWSVQDIESGVEVCTCHLGGQRPAQSTLLPGDDQTKGQCHWLLNDARQGSEVTMTVTCYNAVQLYSTVTSLPATVLLQPPSLTEVTLDSLSNNVFMSPYDRSTPRVRSGNSSLEFFWRGVHDPTVAQFYFRFLRESHPLTDWFPLDAYKTRTVLGRMEKEKGHGDVTAELTAVNARNMTSETLSVTMQLDDTTPRLTGKTATWSWKEGELTLDWRDVFDVTRDVTFSIFAGTEQGYGDVINHVTTKLTHYEGYYEGTLTTVYISIQALYDNGLFTVYTDVRDI